MFKNFHILKAMTYLLIFSSLVHAFELPEKMTKSIGAELNFYSTNGIIANQSIGPIMYCQVGKLKNSLIFYTIPPDFTRNPREFSLDSIKVIKDQNDSSGVQIYTASYTSNNCNDDKTRDASLVKGEQKLVLATSGSEAQLTTTLTCSKNGKEFIKEFFRSCNFTFEPASN